MFRNPNKLRAANRADPVDTLHLCLTTRSQIRTLRKSPITGGKALILGRTAFSRSWGNLATKLEFGPAILSAPIHLSKVCVLTVVAIYCYPCIKE